MNNIEKFENYYKKIYKELTEIINNYNKELIKDKHGYLKDNLTLFGDLNSDGKLIRGFLIALGYSIGNHSSVSYSYPLSLAYEIFQTSVLIHDDIIDNDNLRRGKDTIHYSNYKKYKDYDEAFAKKVSESIGICVGNYGFYEANQVIVNNYKDDKNLARVLNYYNDIILKTIEGELIDVELPFTSKYNLDNNNIETNIMQVYKLKTAYYTIIGPLCLGLILNGYNDDKLEEITRFGEKVGIAFQIQDDILGIYNDMGKVQGSDIKEYKQTILFANTLKNDKYKDELLKYYGKSNITQEEVEAVRKIFKESGSLLYATNMMNSLYEEAKQILINISWIPQEDKDILDGFIEYLKNRKK